MLKIGGLLLIHEINDIVCEMQFNGRFVLCQIIFLDWLFKELEMHSDICIL
jgi:hypothetical protein